MFPGRSKRVTVGFYAAGMPVSRRRRISMRNSRIWFQLGMVGDATLRLITTRPVCWGLHTLYQPDQQPPGTRFDAPHPRASPFLMYFGTG